MNSNIVTYKLHQIIKRLLNIEVENIKSESHTPVFGQIDNLSIVSWNIGIKVENNNEISFVKNTLLDFNCNVILLQEVNWNMLNMIRQKFGNTFNIYNGNIYTGNNNTGNNVVTMIKKNINTNQPQLYLTKIGDCRMIKITLPDLKINIFNLHIRNNIPYKDYEAYVLYALFESFNNQTNSIIAGDFNRSITELKSIEINNVLTIPPKIDNINIFRESQIERVDHILFFDNLDVNRLYNFIFEMKMNILEFYQDEYKLYYHYNNSTINKFCPSNYKLIDLPKRIIDFDNEIYYKTHNNISNNINDNIPNNINDNRYNGLKDKYWRQKYHKYKTLYLQLKEQIENNGL